MTRTSEEALQVRYRRAEGMTWDDAGGSTVILDPQGSTLLTLNQVGTIVWSSLDGPRSVDELGLELVASFPEVEPEQIRNDIEEFMATLIDEGLAVVVEDR